MEQPGVRCSINIPHLHAGGDFLPLRLFFFFLFFTLIFAVVPIIDVFALVVTVPVLSMYSYSPVS